MYQFFESICVKNTPQNLYFHQQRVNQTFKKFYKNYKTFNLKEIFNNFYWNTLKTYKVKIIYSNVIEQIQFEEYIPKYHTNFKFVKIDYNFYKYKFINRFNLIKHLKLPKEEIFFILNNNITDTTYSNLIFKKNNEWFTSKKFLLNGTQRQYLIKKKKIKEIFIPLSSLQKFDSFKLINSMLSLNESIEYKIKDYFTL